MAVTERPKQEKRSFLYGLARLVFGLASSLFFPIKFHGLEMINRKDAPYMLVSNHGSMLDPPMLGVAVKRYEVHFLGKNELNANKLFRYVLDQLHMISVSRHMTDMAAMRACNEVLRKGGVLGLFPEGTRKKPEDLMEGVESGVSLLALRNRVPLMPVYIHDRIRMFRRNHIYFLPELDYSDLAARGLGKDSVDALTERIRQVILAAREAAQKQFSESRRPRQE